MASPKYEKKNSDKGRGNKGRERKWTEGEERQTSVETNLKAKISKLQIKITCSKRQPTKINSFQAIYIR